MKDNRSNCKLSIKAVKRLRDAGYVVKRVVGRGNYGI